MSGLWINGEFVLQSTIEKRLYELERIAYLFVEADDDRDAGDITDAEYKARIMDWTNRARAAIRRGDD